MYRNSRTRILLPTVAAVAVVIGIFIGLGVHPERDRQQMRRMAGALMRPENKLDYALALIGGMYIDSIPTDTLIERLMPALMGELDPHSVYIPAKDLAGVNETLDGEFDGIGVVFNMATDTAIVLNVIPGGPSDKAGLRAGDRIVMVGDTVIAGRKLPQQKVVGMLRGKRGTSVDLKLKRAPIADLIPVSVTRGVIPIKSLDAAFMLTDSIAYVKLSAFSRTSTEELIAALDRLEGEGMRALIFDLRGNTGGFLDQAIGIADEFLPGGRLIVYTEDRFGNRVQEYSTGGGGYVALPLVLLVDEGSASSSEILAGAMQDNDRATIVGRRSFGKGLVQRQLPFADGSAMRLTVAEYYTPSGRSIQKPYRLGADSEYEEEIYDRFLHDEFFTADSIRFDDSLRHTTVGGRTVYGGGGIMPDRFVPLDTTDITRYFIEVSGRNILYRYTIEYADRHRAALDTVHTVAGLKALLDADRGMFDDFIAYAAREGVAPDARQIARSKALMLAQLRAFIGRNTPIEEAGFYSNIGVIDPVMTEAVRVLRESPWPLGESSTGEEFRRER